MSARVLRWLIVAGAIVAVELLCRAGLIDRFTMIPPSEMVVSLVSIVRTQDWFWEDVGYTLRNLVFATALSVIGGFVLGLVIQALPRLRRCLDPLLSSYYSVPTFILYPLLIVIFGIGPASLIVMGAIFGIVAMIVATMNAIDRIPPVFLKYARVARVDPIRTIAFVTLPAITPHLFSGLKLAVAYCMIGVVAGEFILATAGIGRRLSFAYNNFDNATMYGVLILILGFSALLNGLLNACERRNSSAVVPMKVLQTRSFDFALLGIAMLVLWWIFAAIAGPDALSAPLQTLRRSADYLASASFWRHARATGIAFGWACLLSLVGGVALGLLFGLSKRATDVGEPILGTLYSLPKITLYPIILLVFGLSLSAKIAFGVLHGIFPVILLTIGAIRNIKQVYLKTARVLRLTPTQTALTVLLPAVLPEVVTGLRIGFSSALLGTLVAELFASEEGLGFMLIRAMEAHKVTDIMALAVLLFSFAAIVGSLLLAIEHRMQRM